MRNLGLHEIRKEFLDFFKEKEHLVAPSYPLVPINDKSLLLINAGMAPLKPYFTGTEEPPRRRMATCQKCVRTGDIENVGKTSRHGTFFEMLGNFSFGDYFKEESIEWAWEFMTERMGISKDKLWVSVYLEDDDAYDIWKDKVGISEDRIVRLGKKDNFWELEVGPCGPCSEIYVDRGEKYGCDNVDCKPGCDCDRYVEVWNLVFSQYDKDEKGNYNPTPKPNIDTGMGLERIAAVIQGKENIFEVEPISTIIKEVERVSGAKYGSNPKTDMSIRVITDHIRATTFLISDGIIPSNEGRGYVLRRLIRRAARHGKLLGIKGDFLNSLTSVVVNLWRNEYTELVEREAQIKKILKIEEEKFQETIDQGINILNDYIKDIKEGGNSILDGERAFKLYDTYGFPLDLTKEILEEEGLEVDEKAFNEEMEKQRQRARSAREAGDNQAWTVDSFAALGDDIKTDFEGYTHLTLSSKILAMMKGEDVASELSTGDLGVIILDKTPFYPEGGGQTGDTGILKADGFVAKVTDTRKASGGKIIHIVEITEGTVKNNDTVQCEVDRISRLDIARNHSVTHLLHKALKDTLGDHVNQAGSLVLADRLRFDFTHFEAMTKEEALRVEEIVNSKILEGLEVEALEMSLDEAKKIGAAALFNEKYGETVRVVKIGDYSKELCGGTHITNSSQIGLFKIVSESGIASGVRRIEAITGRKVYQHIREVEEQVERVADIVKSNKKDVVDRVQSLSEEAKSLEKELEKIKSKLALSQVDDIINSALDIEGVKVITKNINGMDVNGLRQLGDTIRDKMGSVVVVLGSVQEDKVLLLAMATKDLVTKGVHAGNIIREVAKMTGGGGGGRPDMAQAGGKDPEKLNDALNLVADLVKGQLKK